MALNIYILYIYIYDYFSIYFIYLFFHPVTQRFLSPYSPSPMIRKAKNLIIDVQIF